MYRFELEGLFLAVVILILHTPRSTDSAPVFTDNTNKKLTAAENVHRDRAKSFEDIPTYIKDLYGIVSKQKRPDLMHHSDSVRSYFDEGMLYFHSVDIV